MVNNGMSIRKIAEVLTSKPSTVMIWISKASDHCEKVSEVVLKDVKTSKVEMDELWDIVGEKEYPKKEEALNCQMTLYAYLNFCRKHCSLDNKDENEINRFNSPARQAGLIDLVWNLHELLTFPYHKNSNLLRMHKPFAECFIKTKILKTYISTVLSNFLTDL